MRENPLVWLRLDEDRDNLLKNVTVRTSRRGPWRVRREHARPDDLQALHDKTRQLTWDNDCLEILLNRAVSRIDRPCYH
jgi:hypothetical protein